MIRNVIFDVGGVLMDFDEHRAARMVVDNDADAGLLVRETFGHPDWLRIDRGFPRAECVADMKKRIPQRLHAAADALMARWDDALTPNPEINDLALELAGLGYDIYILSTTSDAFYRFRERIPACRVVKGAVLSFEEKLLKPDPELYRRLFTRFNLIPSQSFFVDDSHLNIEGALWCGMHGCLYRHDIDVLRAALRAEGVNVNP